MAMDPFTGEVKAWVGGIDHNFFQYDHVNVNTKRQVGSTI
jgi:penicillin-binding protein 1A